MESELNSENCSAGSGYGRPFNYVDLFCGAGGLSLGLEKAGLEHLGGFDLDEKAIDVYRSHFGESKGHIADISKMTSNDIFDIVGTKDIDLLAAAPPCQGVSSQNKNGSEHDKRNELILHTLRIIESIKPKAFMIENVPALGQNRGKRYTDTIKARLSDYQISEKIYSCVEYGVPQLRSRYVMVGIRGDLGCEFSPPPSTTTAPLTVRDAIGDMPDPDSDHNFKNHTKNVLNALTIKRFSYVPPGGGWNDIPDRLKWKAHTDCKKKMKQGSWPDVFGRLEWDLPAPTITCGCHSFTKGRFGHPVENRPLTPRECARLQGFPDDYIFSESRKSACKQIGNSVPPPFAKSIGLAVIETLTMSSRKRKRIIDFS